MLPPPAPMELISIWGVRLGRPAMCCSVVRVGSSRSMRQTSVLVPPMS
jgi:hypothetical protein